MYEIFCGDALTLLKRIPDDYVNCCICSPPFYGLRDYGVPEQIGLEESPEEYIKRLVKVFAEVFRVLKKDGTLWLNIGDSYAGSGKVARDNEKILNDKSKHTYKYSTDNPAVKMRKTWNNIKPKDLIGVPWQLAFALRDLGYYLRSDIIWVKPNCFPESVKDRPTSCYEHIFLLSKSRRYYYDYEAITEPIADSTVKRLKRGISDKHKYIHTAVWGYAGYTVLLCVTLFKTSSLSKSIFNSH